MALIAKYLPLFKLRICWLITLSAVVGLAAAPSSAAPMTIAFLALATLTSSAAASALNHYFDRDIDAVMKRTSGRPLAGGSSPLVAPIAAIVLLAVSAAISVWKLNYMATLHLFLGAFVYAVVYTVWLKRRSWLNIIVGGLAGSFAVLAGGASAEPGFCLEPVLLAVVMFFWTPSHFWSFAIVHRDDYERAGVPMLPNVVGDERAAKYILVNTVLLVASSVIPVFMGYFGVVYAVAAFGAGAYFLYWNARLVLNTTKQLAWKNFKASMAYLGILFAGVLLDVLVR
ncbi:MAG TPA: heme o synthase [Thermodesulfobacteriota bacterium]